MTGEGCIKNNRIHPKSTLVLCFYLLCRGRDGDPSDLTSSGEARVSTVHSSHNRFFPVLIVLTSYTEKWLNFIQLLRAGYTRIAQLVSSISEELRL